MAESNKPKVPPAQPHRSTGDTGTPQRGEAPHDAKRAPESGEPDDAKRAPESGEPDDAKRSRGRVIDEQGEPAGDAAGDTAPDKDEHWESGRHKAD